MEAYDASSGYIAFEIFEILEIFELLEEKFGTG
jgi:hypothetical protein